VPKPRGPAAAAAVLRLPLRWTQGDDDAAQGTALERGFVGSVAECGRLLAAELGAELAPTQAFGGEWPVAESAGLLLAPALPLPLPLGPSDGPDAAYRRDETRVWRESAGAEALVLTAEPTAPAPGEPFDLLWFGDAERYLLRGGRLTVDDLFCELRLSPSRAGLEHLLVRLRRADSAVLVGLEVADRAEGAEITVRRPRQLSAEDRWRDPERFLACRADIDGLTASEGVLTATTARGATVVFTVEVHASGWRAAVVEGEYPFAALELEADGEMLALSGALTAAVDPLTPGVRARLAFDLRSDLVMLG
jgi:hypothetical protein